MAGPYKPDYLKVTSKDEDLRNISYVVREFSIIYFDPKSDNVNPLNFGIFNEIFRTSELTILEFRPFSADCGIGEENTSYKTRAQALGAAISFLDKKGYQAKPFDLEGMLEKI